MKISTSDPESKRVRRSAEQLISDLQKKIDQIKACAERKRITKSPALGHMNAALRAIKKAMASCDDSATRQALNDAHATLKACLSLNGVAKPHGGNGPIVGSRERRSGDDVEAMSERLLDYALKHPGERGEHIAMALGTDTKTMRLPMKKLIADGKVSTRGERRGMEYLPI
jgi:hypothetical protein